MLHLPLAATSQLTCGKGCNIKNNLVTVRRHAWSYFAYAAAQEGVQQAALCQVYEDFTGISLHSSFAQV